MKADGDALLLPPEEQAKWEAVALHYSLNERSLFPPPPSPDVSLDTPVNAPSSFSVFSSSSDSQSSYSSLSSLPSFFSSCFSSCFSSSFSSLARSCPSQSGSVAEQAKEQEFQYDTVPDQVHATDLVLTTQARSDLCDIVNEIPLFLGSKAIFVAMHALLSKFHRSFTLSPYSFNPPLESDDIKENETQETTETNAQDAKEVCGYSNEKENADAEIFRVFSQARLDHVQRMISSRACRACVAKFFSFVMEECQRACVCVLRPSMAKINGTQEMPLDCPHAEDSDSETTQQAIDFPWSPTVFRTFLFGLLSRLRLLPHLTEEQQQILGTTCIIYYFVCLLSTLTHTLFKYI